VDSNLAKTERLFVATPKLLDDYDAVVHQHNSERVLAEGI
jgi:hypothetical protein